MRPMSSGRVMVRAVAAAVMVAGGVAGAQTLSVYERVRLNVASTANGGNPQFIGSNPSAIAWTGSTVFLAGLNASGTTGRSGITRIADPLAAPGLGVVPAFAPAFGTRAGTGNGRGFMGLAVKGGVLASAWDNGATTPATTDGMQAFSAQDGGVLWTGSLAGRQMGGVAFDPGFVVGGTSQGGAGVSGLVHTSGRRPLFDVATGTTIYTLSTGFVLNTAPLNTEWRDVDFNPATGDIYSRNANNVSFGIRTGVNSIAGNAQQFLVNNANNGGQMAGQNLAFLGGVVDPAGSFSGDAVIWNNRPAGTTEGSTAFTAANRLVSTTGTAVTVDWNLLFDSAPSSGNGWYDFGYDPATRTLAVMDFQNRTVSIFDLGVDVRSAAAGTVVQAAALSGTVPLAKRGGGILVVDQTAAFAAGTVYVEEGTLQVGAGGTTGFVGAPVAVTVSAGATLAFDRADDYGGPMGNRIGGGGGLLLRGGTLVLTGSGAPGGGTLIAGGTLAIGAGGTTGWLSGPVDARGTLVFDRADAETFTGTISGPGSVVKSGSGSLTLAAANGYSGQTRIAAGTLRLTGPGQTGQGAVVPLAGGTLTVAPRLAATVAGLDPNAGGLVDVGSGGITVAAGLSVADAVAALLAGRGDGTWTGTTGITSSTAAADVVAGVSRAVGWIDAGGGSISLAYAAPGDTNIDGQVDVLDTANFLAGGRFDSGLPATWNEGDFGYDGFVDILDTADFLATGLFDYGPYTGPAAAVAAVPEPAAGTLAVACGACVAAARLRIRRSARGRIRRRRQGTRAMTQVR